LAERWRRPAEVLDIEDAPDVGIYLPSGRVQGGVRITMSEETVERMRLGYMCVKCFEPFEQAWPERCHVCGAPIASRQRDYFEQEFAGVERLGSTQPLNDGRIQERGEEAEK
jgi:hypothetical protein